MKINHMPLTILFIALFSLVVAGSTRIDRLDLQDDEVLTNTITEQTVSLAEELFLMPKTSTIGLSGRDEILTNTMTDQTVSLAKKLSLLSQTSTVELSGRDEAMLGFIFATTTISIGNLETRSSNSSTIASVPTSELDWNRVDQVPTYEQFCSAIDAYSYTRAGGHPPRPSMEVYYHYLDIVARDMSLNEQAMLLANIVWETAGLQFVEEINCKNGSCVYGEYYGRGYIQLTWNYNYRRASFELYGDDRFIRHPELVAGEVDAWRTALWYWKTYVSPTLEQHDAVNKFLIGYSIMAINGQLECRPKSNAKERLRIYNGILKAWHIAEGAVGKMAGCLDEKQPKRARTSTVPFVTNVTSIDPDEVGFATVFVQKIAKTTDSVFIPTSSLPNDALLQEVSFNSSPTPTYDPLVLIEPFTMTTTTVIGYSISSLKIYSVSV